LASVLVVILLNHASRGSNHSLSRERWGSILLLVFYERSARKEKSKWMTSHSAVEKHFQRSLG
jgi:hypothetical protein